MAVKFAIREYSRSGNDVTFTLLALNADGTVDTDFTGNFTWGLNGMSDPGTPTFTAADQGRLVFTTTILNPSVRTGLAANFPGGPTGANISVSGPSGTNTSFGNQGDHLFVGGSGDDIITGNNGNDLFLFVQGGNDTSNGGGGNDIFYFGGAYTGDDTANGGAGDDRLVLQGDYSAGVTLGSLLAVEMVELLSGDVTRFGDIAFNFYDYNITAAAGTVVSNNRLTIDASGLRVGEDLTFDGSATAIDFTVSGGLGSDVLSAGSGNDTVSYAGATSGVTVSLAVSGPQNTLGAGFDTLSGFENLIGSVFDDILTGDDGANVLHGGGGTDVLTGLGGDDVYYTDVAATLAIEAVGGGNDALYTSVSYTLAAGSEIELLSTNSHAATAAINLTGNKFDQTIVGNAGDNVLHGGGGVDRLYGFGGNDIYYTDVAATQVFEAVGGGNDALYTSVSYTLAGNSEIELLSTNSHAATAAISLTGNSFDQTIVGNAGDNVLHGGGGVDRLYGFGGNDIYYTDVAATQVFEAVGGGNDAIYTSVSYTLAAGSEIELLSTNSHAATAAIDLTGNKFDQTIVGNAGANVLHGGGGADVLIGFGGNDIYYTDVADTKVIEAAGGGNDTLYTSVSYTLLAGQEIEILSTNSHAATAAINLTGNEFANTLFGNQGDNVLDGKGGNDILVGVGGNDTFAFTTALGAGNVDLVYNFEAGSDLIALDDAIFTEVGGPGALSASAFVIGSAAADADDRIIYNSNTGQLFYDADGNGAGAAVLFATLAGTPVLSASDFMVI